MGYHVRFRLVVESIDREVLRPFDIYNRIEDDNEHCFSIKEVDGKYLVVTNEMWNSGYGSKQYPRERHLHTLRCKKIRFNYVAVGEDDRCIAALNGIEELPMSEADEMELRT